MPRHKVDRERYIQPVAELMREFAAIRRYSGFGPRMDFAWVGVALYLSVTENA